MKPSFSNISTCLGTSIVFPVIIGCGDVASRLYDGKESSRKKLLRLSDLRVEESNDDEDGVFDALLSLLFVLLLNRFWCKLDTIENRETPSG